jgi:hypothetical protein
LFKNQNVMQQSATLFDKLMEQSHKKIGATHGFDANSVSAAPMHMPFAGQSCTDL